MPTDTYDSFIMIENGRALLKSDAFFALVKYLGFPWSWSGALSILPRPILDWLYERVARNRYRVFGRRQVCLAPKPEIVDRFID
jgi:predicted DCC family thiol-disulfide oxidoreductase YuxK